MRLQHKLLTVLIMCIMANGFTVICQNITDELFIATWNVENLFDTMDDIEKNDEEYLPGGEKDWNYQKLERKILNLTKVIKFMNGGNGPDVIALQEVENLMVCKYLIYEFDKRDYIICHRESPDNRGIDNALLYDRNVLDIVRIENIRVDLPSEYPTRDILYVSLVTKNENDTLHFYVNHWPSRRGGKEKSQINRISAANVLTNHIENNNLWDREVIILGDFNDEPADSSISEVLKAKFEETIKDSRLINLAGQKFLSGEGSYLYKGDWNMLDQIIITRALSDSTLFTYEKNSFEVLKPDFMITKEGKYAGSARPTYGGKNYLGGYSDHFPVSLKLKYIR